MTKKQRQLWIKVRRAILRYPDQFDMEWWFQDRLAIDGYGSNIKIGNNGFLSETVQNTRPYSFLNNNRVRLI